MAKYTFDQAKRNVAEIANRDSYTKEFIFELMAAYGRATSAINQLKSGAIDKSTDPNALLQKGVLYFKVFPQGTLLEEKVEQMGSESLFRRYEPRYIVATDLHHIVAKDAIKHTTLDIEIKDIDNEVAFFYGWTGNEISKGSADESVADRRAADKMKDLYDEIERENIDSFKADPVGFRHDLNVFFSRLLFCFFAEDTGLFRPKQLTNSIKEYTETDGSNLDLFFKELFKSLDSEDKSGMTTPYSEFPYVNGSLFDTKEHNIAIPKFSPTARHILILCADLDWSGVNPDIFGTIFQGIVDETRRDENGMDYTSVPNILKVINPLFMDELHEEFDKAFDDQNRLFKLWGRISKIKVFDPACGSGNFLIISYKKLRELEHDIVRRIAELKRGVMSVKLNSQIKLDHFFGIEIEDFPRELAVLSMYIAAHQMNVEFEKEFGKKISIIPLVDMPTIYRGNSAQLEWQNVCPKKDDDEVYVIGNPPYKGAKKQTPEQKNDFKKLFSGIKYNKNLDYISIWFIKGSKYIRGSRAKLAFVSTNSVVQGEQIENMWLYVFENDAEISRAWTSFKWSNSASNMAAVTCVIIALQDKNNACRAKKKLIYTDSLITEASNINAYLTDGPDIIVSARRTPISPCAPAMVYGNMPLDGNALKLTKEEKDEILEFGEKYEKFIRPMIGGRGMVDGQERWCLWIEDSDLEEAKANPVIERHIEACRQFRIGGGDVARTLTYRAHQFRYRKVAKKNMILTPCTTTANREYIPSIIVGSEYITDNSVQVIFDSDIWIFSVISSAIHMAWVKAVCGRLQDNYRYSAMLGYNTFPIPNISNQQQEKLNASARNILFARANHPELTLADMYDPNKMPEDLRQAHEENDILVDKLYRSTPFQTDEARLATLFKLYEEMTGRE